MLSVEENLEILKKRIVSLNLEGNTIIAFDFDELIVPVHLTREITKKVSKPIDVSLLNKLGGSSFEGISYLGSLMIGNNFKKYSEIRDKIVDEVDFRIGVKELLETLLKRYNVIVISSGLKDICNSKLKSIDFNENNILASEFKIEKEKIAGSNLIISDKLKGEIIKILKRNYRIVSIGHSSGDKYMLKYADISISFDSKIKDLARYNVRSPKEIIKIIDNNID